MMNLQPLGNLVLVEPIEEEMRGSIAIPEKMRDAAFAWVRAIGPGKKTPLPLAVGEKVMLDAGTVWEDVEVDGRPHRLINFNHILAVMEEA